MRQGSLLIFIIISILCSTSSYAFDDERKGFIFGGGLGIGYLSNTTSLGSLSETDSRIVVPMNLKIGYAPSNTLEIFYIVKMEWWGKSGETYSLGLLGAAFTLYLDNVSETDWFVSGGIGYASLAELYLPTGNSASPSNETGFGLFGGVGYEFSKHWTVEVDLLYSSVSNDNSDTSAFGVLVTVNFLEF
jgi:opacity protein-like surface antigen